MIFTPEDFGYEDGNNDTRTINCEKAAEYANAKLKEWIAASPTVYGHVKKGVPNWWGPHEGNIFDDTHIARTVCIEEIK